MTPRSRMGDSLLEGALGVGEGLGGAAEPHLAADVVAALEAEGALAARLADLEGDLVADLEGRDARADGGHDARRLVAERQGLPHQDVAVAEVVEVVQVRAAETRGLDGDLDLVGGGGRELAIFLDSSCISHLYFPLVSHPCPVPSALVASDLEEDQRIGEGRWFILQRASPESREGRKL